MISRMVVHRRRIALSRPFVTAVRRAAHLDVTLVEAQDDAGRSGWGEAAVSWRVTGESPESVAAVVAGPLTDVVVGRDAADPALPAAIAGAVWANASARSAVECAALDLAAQRAGKSFAQSLGAAALSVRTDMTLSAGSVASVADAAASAAEAGFTTMKLKADASTDLVAALRAVRAAAGNGVTIRVDANQAWSADDAVARLRAVAAAGITLELVEQPVAADDVEGLARVRASVDVPILADEAVRSSADLDRVLAMRAADAVNLKLAKTGGPTEILRLAARARDGGLGVIVGCMLESTVGVAAAAAVAGSCAPDAVHDLDGGLLLAASPVVGGASYERERIRWSGSSGLGIRAITEELG